MNCSQNLSCDGSMKVERREDPKISAGAPHPLMSFRLTLAVPRRTIAACARFSLAHVCALEGVAVEAGSRIVVDARRRVDPDHGVRRAASAPPELRWVLTRLQGRGRAAVRCGRGGGRRLLPPREQRS